MKISVIIVSYNVRYYIEQCLLSLEKALDGIESEIFVVDNHSRDDSVKYLSQRFHNVQFIESRRNLGFSRANNIAIKQSEGEYILLLNPDTLVAEDTIREALKFMDEHPDAGACGVKMYGADGSVAKESRRGLPSPMVSFYKMAGLCSRFPDNKRFAHYYMSYLPWDSPQQIEVISGAFFLGRRKAIEKAGRLDEDYFMYGEDIDLSFQILNQGYKNYYLPLPMIHYKGESTQKSSFRYVHVFYNAMLIFFRKHYSHLSFCISLPIMAAIYCRAAMALAQMNISMLRRSLGFVDKRTPEPLYLCLGSAKMINQCRRMAKRMGLDADFAVCNAGNAAEVIDSLMEQHSVETRKKQRVVYATFDADTFSYTEMIRQTERLQGQNVRIGTYHYRSKVLVTPEDVFCDDRNDAE